MTLLEVMIALFVLSAMVLVFSSSVIVANRAAFMSGQYANAISIAQHKIDQMRAIGYGRVWDTATNKPNYVELNEGNIVDDGQTPAGPTYSFVQQDELNTDEAKTKINYLPSPIATIKVERPDATKEQIKVTVTVSWTWKSFNSKRSNLVLTGLLTNSG